MKYYTIQNDGLLIAENKQALTRFYDNVKPLPDDYEEGKYIVEDNELVLNPNYEEEQAQKERQRLNNLSLTKREVFLALYKDKGITPEQIKAQITNSEALIEFEYANDYYRGNPLINQIGETLGYSSDDLDYLFENKELPAVEIIDSSDEGSEELPESAEVEGTNENPTDTIE